MITDVKPYPAYKPSRVPSLGDIPEHWGSERQRHLVQMLVSTVDKHTVEGEVPVRMCNYVDVYKNERVSAGVPFMRATASRDEVARFRLRTGDVVITKDSESWNDIGVPALVEYESPDLVCGYHLAVLRPRDGRVLPGFLLRALQSQGVAYQYHVRANGVTRYGLSHDAIKSVVIPTPPPAEQAAIIRFLDYADRRIRRYIAAKQRLIKLLEEQKQAIIYRAVTRGLDAHVPLKPSGVEWIGDIPKHWRVVRLKSLARSVTSGSRGWSNFATDSGALFIRIGNLTRASIDLDLSDVIRLSLPASVRGEAIRTRVQPSDLLLSITAFIGSVAVVPTGIEEAYVSQHVACCRLRTGAAEARWVAYVLLSPVGQVHGKLCMSGGTKQGLSLIHI